MASDFLLSITRVTTTKRTVMIHAELRGDSEWRHCMCLITALCHHDPPKLGLAITLAGDRAEATKPSRAKQLEQHMWRIAAEVLAARLLPPVSDTLAIDRAGDLAELTSHQFEITMRLANGERVPAIAKAMHLSPSTIRNHLSAVFRRFDVHSQGELISLLKNSSQPP
jgi:DNA-binding NarL/FixJ family response regulator